MNVPLSWLHEYLELDRPVSEIVDKLALLGFPVDELVQRTPLSGVVIGKIVALEKHPNADRLQVCTIDIGAAETLTIATAATNVARGQTIPVATIGAKLAQLEIGPRKMRGIDSQGMLCSASELGLPEEWFEDGILQLEDGLPLGDDFVARYRLNDPVLSVEVTSNRVDAMSITGLARELAAAYGLEIREPQTHPAWAAPRDVTLTKNGRTAHYGDTTIALESPDCKRFVAQRFSIAGGGIAPFWMRVRLALAGQRPIDRLVDVSNYVMFELGQPLHFYDFGRLQNGELIVRDAKPGEHIVTLDGVRRALPAQALVIADAAQAQCLAGLMGGSTSEVSSATSEVLLEAATFNGPRVRRMSAALGLRTEASSRHEKGLPFGLADAAAARAAYLLESFGAEAFPAFAAGAVPTPPGSIAFSNERVWGLLGFEATNAEIENALRGLGFHVVSEPAFEQFGDLPACDFRVTPPPWRSDVAIVEDVIEEIARIVGYDRVTAVQPAVFEQTITSDAYDDERRLARALAAAGYREALSLSLESGAVRERFARAGLARERDSIEVRNPLSEDQRYLRFSLLPGLLSIVACNQNVLPLRLFEIGHVFEESATGDHVETAAVAWLFATRPQANEADWRDDHFLLFKGECEAIVRAYCGRVPEAQATTLPHLHPGKTAALTVAGKPAVIMGALDPRLRAAYELEADVYVAVAPVADLPAYALPRYIAPSKFPPLERDLAVVVPAGVPARAIEDAVRAGANGVLTSVRVFDEYRGAQIEAGHKSVAVRFVLQRRDATLTDAEAAGYVTGIVTSLRERTGARVRE